MAQVGTAKLGRAPKALKFEKETEEEMNKSKIYLNLKQILKYTLLIGIAAACINLVVFFLVGFGLVAWEYFMLSVFITGVVFLAILLEVFFVAVANSLNK